MAQENTAITEKSALRRTLRWQDAFALAMSVSSGLFVAFGATMAAIGALAAMF